MNFLRSYGNHPRDLESWWGIFSMHFLHSEGSLMDPNDNFNHIWNNSASFFVLNMMVFYFYREVALKTWAIIMVFSGLFVFGVGVIGSNHIGASAIVYGLAFFLITAGLINMKNLLMLRVTLVVLFLYGSIIWGIFPIEEKVSWEGHMGGAIAGVFSAVYFRQQLPVAPKTKWEIEEELEQLKSEREKGNPIKPNGKTPVVQIYRQFRHRGMDRGF